MTHEFQQREHYHCNLTLQNHLLIWLLCCNHKNVPKYANIILFYQFKNNKTLFIKKTTSTVHASLRSNYKYCTRGGHILLIKWQQLMLPKKKTSLLHNIKRKCYLANPTPNPANLFNWSERKNIFLNQKYFFLSVQRLKYNLTTSSFQIQ